MKRDTIYILIATALWVITLVVTFEPAVNNRLTGVMVGLMIPRLVRGTIESITELIATFKKINS